MTNGRATPIVVGVGDFKNSSQRVEDAIEPMKLMLKAILLALADTNLPSAAISKLQSDIDSLDIVRTWTWPYPDLPVLLSQQLGIEPQHKSYSEHGGNQPAKLFDEAARRIMMGENKVAVITGGEALASLKACVATKTIPPTGWSEAEHSVDAVFSPTTLDLGQNYGAAHSIGSPVQVYPLFENGLRARRGQSFDQNNKESAQMYASFAKIAEKNPNAWYYGKVANTEEVIGTVSRTNRMICLPYPLLMNAFNAINISAACILTSTDYARQLGIPESRWIYPLGGAGTRDSYDFWGRPNFYSSPALSRSLDAALEVSGLQTDQIDIFDLYSCFPIVPKLACQHLGLPTVNGPRPITLLGGLTFFGGAGNNYSMHAITEMVRQLRRKGQSFGLVLANGGVLTYQHVVCLSSQPRKSGTSYPTQNPLPEVLTNVPVPPTESTAEGKAIIETYTVEFNRDGSPLRGYIAGITTSNGHRFVANHADDFTLKQLLTRTKEIIGRHGWVRADSGNKSVNLFSLETPAKI